MLFGHDSAATDPLLRPTFPAADRIRRLVWKLVSWFLFRLSPIPFFGWRAAILRFFGAQVGDRNFIYPTAKIWAPWMLTTEDFVTIGPNAEIYNPGGVSLGHHTIVSQDAYLCGATHDYHSPEFTYVKKRIETGAYAWICARAIVLPGVICGEGSVLGAGSVTSRSLDPWAVYAGNPAEKRRMRDRHV